MFASRFDGQTRRRMLGCVAAAAALAALGQVYQLFGHGVRSLAMTLCFLWPLLGGAAHLAAWALLRGRALPPDVARVWQNLLFAGLAALVAGQAYRGVVEIAGVDGGWEALFFAVGAALAALGTAGLWFAHPPTQKEGA